MRGSSCCDCSQGSGFASRYARLPRFISWGWRCGCPVVRVLALTGYGSSPKAHLTLSNVTYTCCPSVFCYCTWIADCFDCGAFPLMIFCLTFVGLLDAFAIHSNTRSPVLPALCIHCKIRDQHCFWSRYFIGSSLFWRSSRGKTSYLHHEENWFHYTMGYWR